jgi:cyclic pyranopterin phosphate synthase
MSRKLSHVAADGAVRMVNVAGKRVTRRRAVAQAVVRMKASTLSLILNRRIAKGNVFETARLAGIQAAKRTHELIPLCHPLRIGGIDVTLEARPPLAVRIEARVEGRDRTGFEMEALTAAAVAALTLYDMCKAVERGMEITDLCLLEKAGGRSGRYVKPDEQL